MEKLKLIKEHELEYEVPSPNGNFVNSKITIKFKDNEYKFIPFPFSGKYTRFSIEELEMIIAELKILNKK